MVRSGGERSEHHLSEREREVLALLCTGATNHEIAAAMNVGIETVKKHAGAVYRKLGVRNRTEAAQRAATVLTAPAAHVSISEPRGARRSCNGSSRSGSGTRTT